MKWFLNTFPKAWRTLLQRWKATALLATRTRRCGPAKPFSGLTYAVLREAEAGATEVDAQG